MKTKYITIAVNESDPRFDEGERVVYVAHIDAPNGRKAMANGLTRAEAIRNLINASGPITRSAVNSYLNQ